jgi:U4/U6.U5 tri-snRNP component SNU23
MSVRRTWDKEAYKAKALRRLEEGDGVGDEDEEGIKIRRNKEEFRAAPEGAAGPMGSERAFLSARSDKVDLDSKVGKTEVVKPAAASGPGGAGFYCETCECLLKDSASYLSHINGKKHQRALGFSMRVERADVNRVRDKMQSLKRALHGPDGDSAGSASALEKYEERAESARATEEAHKKQRRERELALKAEREAAELEDADPEMAALMGFGGFK